MDLRANAPIASSGAANGNDRPTQDNSPSRFSFGESCFYAAAGIAKFARAHAANFVGCRPATLLASAIASRESAPR